jgi:2-phosphosulfolactate phosphatase
MAEDPRTHANDPFSQAKYQVRFDQGATAANRIAGGADIAVWVGALGPEEAGVESLGASPDFLDAIPADCAVVASGLVDAHAVASWILAEQERLGRRAYIAIVAAGESRGAFDATGVLAAGALIDALAELGIDDTSPEAAVACAAFVGLRRAVGHLVTASGAGRAAISGGVSAEAVRAAGRLRSSDHVRIVKVANRPEPADRQ